MKVRPLSFSFFLFLAAPILAQETKPAAAPAPAPAAALDPAQVRDRASYYFGTDVAKGFRTEMFELNVDQFIQGFKDTLEKKNPKFTEQELTEAMTQFEQSFKARQQQQMAAAATKNVEEGKKFLEENGKKAGVTTTASGLQYEVLKKGEGAKPKADDTVTVHYEGTLLNGKVFDSSIKRGEPATFPLNQVIPGWTEGVQLMSVGSKFKFVIPSNLAYAERGAGQDIGPNSTLVFEVELLSIGAPKQ